MPFQAMYLLCFSEPGGSAHEKLVCCRNASGTCTKLFCVKMLALAQVHHTNQPSQPNAGEWRNFLSFLLTAASGPAFDLSLLLSSKEQLRALLLPLPPQTPAANSSGKRCPSVQSQRHVGSGLLVCLSHHMLIPSYRQVLFQSMRSSASKSCQIVDCLKILTIHGQHIVSSLCVLGNDCFNWFNKHRS